MFLAGILPGLLAYSLYMITILIVSRFWTTGDNSGLGEETSLGKALRLFVPTFVLFGLVMGGLYGGFFTPTEAGGAGALFALVYAMWRGIGRDGLMRALRNTVAATAGIFLILIGAEVYGFVVSTSQISFALSDYMRNSGLEPWQVLALILAFYIVLGCFMESLAMILLTIPIFFPVVVEAGYDPIWFGIIAVVTVELGLITPPVGMNLFMVKSSAPDLEQRSIMIGVLPFVVSDIIRLGLLIAFPAIALTLT